MTKHKPTLKAILMVMLAAQGCGYLGESKYLKRLIDKDDSTRPEPSGDPIPPVRLPGIAPEYFSLSPSLSNYESCDQLQAEVREQLKVKQQNDRERAEYYRQQAQAASRQKAANPAAAQGAVADNVSPSEAGNVLTNTQEHAVDESDVVKIGKSQIYIANDSEVQVVNRSDLKLIGKLSFPQNSKPSLFATGDKLVVMSVENQRTRISVFHEQPGALPALVKEHSYAGSFHDARLIESRLYVVIRDVLELEPIVIAPSDWIVITEGPSSRNNSPAYLDLSDGTISDRPVKQEGNKVAGTECNRIAKMPVKDLDFRLTKIVGIDLGQLDKAPTETAALGGSDFIYMSQKSLYVLKQGVAWRPFVRAENTGAVHFAWLHDELIVSKASLGSSIDQLGFVAGGLVTGRIKDQWAAREYEGELLALATTTGQLWGKDNIAQNHLIVVEQKDNRLEVAGKYNNYGTGEDIRAIRYVGSLAYVVTFKKTDPLYAFDMSQPREPKLLGELKIPGFSVYMHPVAQGRMLGVGFDALDQGDFALYQGIQISLFDTSNPRDLRRIDNKVHGARGSSSEVTSDHKAFFFDPENNLTMIPLTELGGGADIRSMSGSSVKFSGAVVYQIRDNQLIERTRISHQEKIPAECKSNMGWQWWSDKSRSLDINRVYKVDGSYLSVSRFAIKRHPIDDPQQVIAETTLPQDLTACSATRYHD